MFNIRVPNANRENAQVEQSPAPPNIQRRVFITTSLATLAGLALWQWKRPARLEAAAVHQGEPGNVTIVLFSESGERLKQASVSKVIKTPGQWRAQLSGNAYDITRNADTEVAFSGKYWNLHDKGLYRCTAATMHCSVQKRNSSQAPDGQFLAANRKGERHRDSATRVLEWSAWPFRVLNATLI